MTPEAIADIRGCLITAGVQNGNIDAINRLPFPQIQELYGYWTYHPPAHEMLRMIGKRLGLQIVDRPKPRTIADLTPEEKQWIFNPNTVGRTYADLDPAVRQFVRDVKEGRVVGSHA